MEAREELGARVRTWSAVSVQQAALIFIISMSRKLAKRSRGICVSLMLNTSPTLVRRAG